MGGRRYAGLSVVIVGRPGGCARSAGGGWVAKRGDLRAEGRRLRTDDVTQLVSLVQSVMRSAESHTEVSPRLPYVSLSGKHPR
ncbi:hypothetical protein Ait01nite_053310 [Actinoplanes italicus]|nr:hypothetical protein Ait01nite_053310 [Actinoplanes italicus]